jgi:hypothetical protein
VKPIPADANGYTFIAYFHYENANSTAVFVPIGTDNIVTGLGRFELSNQPELFLPGGGDWEAQFDGNKVTWAVKSYNGTHKSSTASYASSTSSKCTKSDEVIIPDETAASNLQSDVFVAYPNPTSAKVYINLGESKVADKDVVTYDHLGNACPAKIINAAGPVLEMDFSELRSGIYIIRLLVDGEYKFLRIIRK